MEPIQASSIPEAIVQRVILLISDGTWKAGDQLPSQRHLSREFGVSMTSLREALQTLQGMGVIELRHGEGTFVCRNPSQIVERCLNLALTLDRDRTQDFLDARRAVEGGMAYLAATRATPEQLSQLTELVDGMKLAIEDEDAARYKSLDISFHQLIAAMSHSEILQYVGNIIFDTLLEDFIRLVPNTMEGWQRHAAVCAAIQNSAPDHSEQAMHELVDATAAYIHIINHEEECDA